jgi:hypothetical protein
MLAWRLEACDWFHFLNGKCYIVDYELRPNSPDAEARDNQPGYLQNLHSRHTAGGSGFRAKDFNEGSSTVPKQAYAQSTLSAMRIIRRAVRMRLTVGQTAFRRICRWSLQHTCECTMWRALSPIIGRFLDVSLSPVMRHCR